MDKDFAFRTIRRILHSFVTLKLNDNATLGQVSELLDTSTDELYRLFEDDLTAYRKMLDAMDSSGYSQGPAGLASMVLDLKRYRENFRAIRRSLRDTGTPYSAEDIAQAVEERLAKCRGSHPANFDVILHNDMRQLLEDAGFSPDPDGLKALLEKYNRCSNVLRKVRDQAVNGLVG